MPERRQILRDKRPIGFLKSAPIKSRIVLQLPHFRRPGHMCPHTFMRSAQCTVTHRLFDHSFYTAVSPSRWPRRWPHLCETKTFQPKKNDRECVVCTPNSGAAATVSWRFHGTHEDEKMIWLGFLRTPQPGHISHFQYCQECVLYDELCIKMRIMLGLKQKKERENHDKSS